MLFKMSEKKHLVMDKDWLNSIGGKEFRFLMWTGETLNSMWIRGIGCV